MAEDKRSSEKKFGKFTEGKISFENKCGENKRSAENSCEEKRSAKHKCEEKRSAKQKCEEQRSAKNPF